MKDQYPLTGVLPGCNYNIYEWRGQSAG